MLLSCSRILLVKRRQNKTQRQKKLAILSAKVSVDELQSKKYLETNWKVGAYQILWKGHDCSNMEFWKHVQLPQPSDGCSFPHGGNPDWSWDSATVPSNGKERHGQALGCATDVLHGLCVISGSVSFQALWPWASKGGQDSCICKFSDLLKGANFLLPLPFSATLHKLCCKTKVHLLKANLVCALGSLLVTVAAGWGRASVRFCFDTEWWVVFHTCCAVSHNKVDWSHPEVTAGWTGLSACFWAKLVCISDAGRKICPFFLCRRARVSNLQVQCGEIWLVFLWFVCCFLNSRLEHWGDGSSWRIKMRKLSYNLGLYSLKEDLWFISGF